MWLFFLFCLLQATKGQYFLSIIIFSLAPPIGTVIGIVLTLNSSDSGSEVVNISEELPLQILQALATGTVIYVIFFEIFPKAKEIGGTGFQHVISSIIGFAVFLPTLAFHAAHEHHEDDESNCTNLYRKEIN